MATPAPEKIVTVAFEDEPEDIEKIKSALETNPIFSTTVYDTYKGNVESAKNANILSLDVEVGKDREKSKLLAQLIKKTDPFKSIVFFSSYPDEVLEEPVNFVLKKSAPVWRAYDRILLMVWIHDRCLALLKATNDYYNNDSALEFRRVFEEVIKDVRRFYPSLFYIIDNTRTADHKLKNRYSKLRDVLHPIIRDVVFDGDITEAMAAIRIPLMEIVEEESEHIKGIKGVYTTNTYKREFNALKSSIIDGYLERGLPLPVYRKPKARLYFKDRAKLFFVESFASSLRTLDRALAPLKVPRLKGTWDSVRELEAASIETQDEWGATNLEESQSKEMNEPETESGLYLHAWFEKQGDGRLYTGKRALLLVNLGTLLDISEEGIKDRLPEDTESLVKAVEYVDIVVLCPDAEVVPLRNRLFMPPDPEKPTKFNITPLTEGDFDLTIMIMIRNEPIHRTVFTCTAHTDPSSPIAKEQAS